LEDEPEITGKIQQLLVVVRLVRVGDVSHTRRGRVPDGSSRVAMYSILRFTARRAATAPFRTVLRLPPRTTLSAARTGGTIEHMFALHPHLHLLPGLSVMRCAGSPIHRGASWKEDEAAQELFKGVEVQSLHQVQQVLKGRVHASADLVITSSDGSPRSVSGSSDDLAADLLSKEHVRDGVCRGRSPIGATRLASGRQAQTDAGPPRWNSQMLASSCLGGIPS
jgi:hypothetical protein